MSADTRSQTEKIRDLNDQFRKTGEGGHLFVTSTVIDQGNDFVQAAITAMREFDDFTVNNDPYGEHDFGKIIIGSETVFWKMDYYGTSMKYGSNDPSDPEQTIRVLTIMLASDY